MQVQTSEQTFSNFILLGTLPRFFTGQIDFVKLAGIHQKKWIGILGENDFRGLAPYMIRVVLADGPLRGGEISGSAIAGSATYQWASKRTPEMFLNKIYSIDYP